MSRNPNLISSKTLIQFLMTRGGMVVRGVSVTFVLIPSLTLSLETHGVYLTTVLADGQG